MIWSVSTLRALQRHGDAGDGRDLLHQALTFSPRRRAGIAARRRRRSRSHGLDSVPRIAVAAATSGDTRWVRPPLPWRPSKLRLRGGGAALPRRQLVGVHPEAHRAAGEAPLGAELLDDLVDALGLGLDAHAGASPARP